MTTTYVTGFRTPGTIRLAGSFQPGSVPLVVQIQRSGRPWRLGMARMDLVAIFGAQYLLGVPDPDRSVDIAGPVTQLDVRLTVLLSVLVGMNGEVVCVKTVSGSQTVRAYVEKAVRLWRFKRAAMNGKPVAYLGWLEFTLAISVAVSEVRP